MNGRIDTFYYQNHYKVFQDQLEGSDNVKSLDELLTLMSSGVRPEGGVANIESGVLSFGGEHINDQCDIEIITPKYIPHEFHILHNKTETQLNDILLVKDGATTGKIGIVRDTAHTGQNINEHLFLLRAKDNVNPIYLLNYLNSYFGRLQIQREISGATVTGITKDVVKQLKIILPTPEIQNDVAEIMQSAYTAKKRKDQEADALLDSIDNYVLTELGIEIPTVEEKKCFVVYAGETAGGRIDPFYYKNHYKIIETLLSRSSNVKRLNELLELINSGSRPKGGVANIASGVLSLGGEHINNQCEVEINMPRYIPDEFHSLHKKTETQLNDLLLVKDGATTGKIGIVSNPEHIGQNINEHLFLLRARKDVNPIYLLSYLNSCFGKLQIQREITGATVTGITRDVVKRLGIILPDLEKQTKIANHITEIRSNAKQLQQEAKAVVEEAKERVEQILLAEA